jgi:hypothetical protein
MNAIEKGYHRELLPEGIGYRMAGVIVDNEAVIG